MCACVHVRVHVRVCMRACVRASACVHACMRVCARVRACVCVCVCVRVCFELLQYAIMKGKPWEIYHVNDINVYLDRQKGKGSPTEKMCFTLVLNNKWKSVWF